MPVRKIPKNHLFVTGRHATDLSPEMVEFESPLEKDFMLLLDFDPRVSSYEAQPVRIPLPDGGRYVPDLLVSFHQGPDGVEPPRDLLEVKTQAFLDRYADEYAVKFAAAEAYVLERGWRFRKKTEKEIRTPRLANIKFLRGYRRNVPHPAESDILLTKLQMLGGRSSSRALVEALGSTDMERAQWLPVLWHLIAVRRISVDMDIPFEADVPLWLEA